MSKKVLIIICSIVIVLGISSFFIIKEITKVKIVNTKEDKYVAYVKINPSIKLDYVVKCIEYSDKKIKCEEPSVYQYDLVNEDAKEIFKDVNLLEKSKDLYSVINNIVAKVSEKGIDTNNIEINSDWKEINTYIDSKKEEHEKEVKTNTSDINNKETKEENNNTNNTNIDKPININVNVQKEAEIKNEISEDITKEEIRIAEEKKKEEERIKKEEEEKKKKEEEEKTKLASTINLSDNVTYDETMLTYSCKNCFSDSLLKTLKKAKGYNVTTATSSELTFHKITKLSGKYNSKTFFGNDLTNKILAAGAENTGGAGSQDNKLTSQICKKYNLNCQ